MPMLRDPRAVPHAAPLRNAMAKRECVPGAPPLSLLSQGWADSQATREVTALEVTVSKTLVRFSISYPLPLPPPPSARVPECLCGDARMGGGE